MSFSSLRIGHKAKDLESNILAFSLIDVAKKHGYYGDLLGLGRKAFSDFTEEHQVFHVARFLLRYDQMWEDIGNLDPESKLEDFKGRQPLYLDIEHTRLNPNLKPFDYLVTLKEFQNQWSAEYSLKCADESWDIMQEEFARIIRIDYLKRELSLI